MKLEMHPDLRATAARACRPDGALWVFGYGSLMWAPGFEAAEMRPARLYGYHRRFRLHSLMAWGSPERPGLCATLHHGGSVAGRGLLLRPKGQGAALTELGRREAAYLPRLVRIHIGRSGGDADWQPALTFVFNPDHPRSAHGLDIAQSVALIRQGQGSSGRSHDYLRRVVEELHRDGTRDRAAEHLLRAADKKPL